MKIIFNPLFLYLTTFCISLAAATITTNIESNAAICPGEELKVKCTGQSTFHRWIIRRHGGDIILPYQLFTEADPPGKQLTFQNYHLTLISSAFHHFESTLSTAATNNLNNAVVECADDLSIETTKITVQLGIPYIAIYLI